MLSTISAPARIMPRSFGLYAHHEARNILHIQDGQIMPLGVFHKVSHFARRFRVDNAANPRPGLCLQKPAPVGDDSNVRPLSFPAAHRNSGA